MMIRQEAYKVLEAVLLRNRHAHLVLKELDLPERDQAFVSALTYTCLQHYMYLNYQIEDLIDQNLPESVRLILIMGVCQLFKMDGVPDYAVVNESVELAKRLRLQRYHGVVNAVLKKVIQRGTRPLEGDPVEVAALEYSMPLWILKLLQRQYSLDFALEYARYCQAIKPNYVRLNPRKSFEIRDDYLEILENTVLAKPPLFQSDYFAKGYCLIQDINSQKVAPMLDLKPNLKVLDCCCGPGTKTVHISDLMQNSGHIDGVELHASRSQTTEALLERWGTTNATIHTQDVLQYESDTEYDRILLDAPCSGLGVLSHKHDLRYHIKPEDLDALETLQQDMLKHIAQFLKVEGIMVYATCTLNKKENERQVERFLKEHENFTLETQFTSDPVASQGDGFYIAKLKRTW